MPPPPRHPAKRDQYSPYAVATTGVLDRKPGNDKGDMPPNSQPELWVFGYGSLMWRPGFDFSEKTPRR